MNFWNAQDHTHWDSTCNTLISTHWEPLCWKSNLTTLKCGKSEFRLWINGSGKSGIKSFGENWHWKCQKVTEDASHMRARKHRSIEKRRYLAYAEEASRGKGNPLWSWDCSFSRRSKPMESADDSNHRELDGVPSNDALQIPADTIVLQNPPHYEERASWPSSPSGSLLKQGSYF